MFRPPRCPNRHCPQHHRPRPRFFVRRGSYKPLCRPHPVPRYQCRTCHRGFSRQTFRADYRDHRPDLNANVFLLLATGLGLRQTARNVGLTHRCTELKFRKIARHLRRLNLNLRGLLIDPDLQFDELETFEGRRNTRPLSLPLLIDRGSRFVIWGESAPIRPSGRMSEARKRAILDDERRFGPRKDLSGRSVLRTLRRGADLCPETCAVGLSTDEKPTYPMVAHRAFAPRPVLHAQTNSQVPRRTWNPLFAINHTEAMIRDHQGRLRRDTWLASKKRRYLDLAVQVWMAYRNYVRQCFNYDKRSPAQRLGFVPRRMRPEELLSWRQDWGPSSIHPLARSGAPMRV